MKAVFFSLIFLIVSTCGLYWSIKNKNKWAAIISGVVLLVLVIHATSPMEVYFHPLMGRTISLLVKVAIFAGIVYGAYYLFRTYYRPDESRLINNWKRQGITDVDNKQIQHELVSIAESNTTMHDEDIPFGRAEMFAQQFDDIDTENLEYYGYSPVRSLDKVELKEYGVLVTNRGILAAVQSVTFGNEKDGNKYVSSLYDLKFKGLWSVENSDTSFVFKYADNNVIRIDKKTLPQLTDPLVNFMQRRISDGYTRNQYYMMLAENNDSTGNRQLDKHIRDMYERQMKRAETITNASLVGAQAANQGMRMHLNNIQYNSIVNQRQGHGVAAEHANDVIDRSFGKEIFKTMTGKNTQVGQDNAAGGPDRFVGGTPLQVKYCRTPQATLDAYLEKGYLDKGIPLEAPRDQYAEVKQLLNEKIESGEVTPKNGQSNDPDVADKMVRKGSVTYNQAMDITKAGNLTSISVDAIDGALMSAPYAGIGFICVFIQGKWSGLDTEEAVKMSTAAALKTIGSGALVNVAAQQFGKTEFAKGLAKRFGKNSVDMAKYASNGITAAIIYGPSVVDTLRGRISPNQLIKNSAVGTAGLIGGMVGSGAGPVGTVVGSMVGGYIGKKVMDEFIEDDAEEMYQIIREEFLDTVFQANLNQEEFEEIINRTFANKKLPKIMKTMFASDNPRKYAREHLMHDNIVDLYKQRETVTDDDVIEAAEYEQNTFAMA